MAHFFAAYIPSQHYSAFRALLHDKCPGTHDEWFYLYTNRLANIRGRGHTCVEVQVEPDEFAEYLRAHDGDRSVHPGLDNFVAFKQAERKS